MVQALGLTRGITCMPQSPSKQQDLRRGANTGTHPNQGEPANIATGMHTQKHGSTNKRSTADVRSCRSHARPTSICNCQAALPLQMNHKTHVCIYAYTHVCMYAYMHGMYANFITTHKLNTLHHENTCMRTHPYSRRKVVALEDSSLPVGCAQG